MKKTKASKIAGTVVLVLSLTPAFALGQATTVTRFFERPQDFTTDNPCNGDLVHVTCTAEFLISITRDATGGRHAITKIDFRDVSAVSEVTGLEYEFVSHVTQQRNDSLTGSFTNTISQTDELLLVPHDGTGGFIVKFTFHATLDAAGDEVVFFDRVVDVTCR